MAPQVIPQKMRAVLFNRPVQTLELKESWPVPKPDFENDEHLLKVNCMAVTNGELTWPFPDDNYDDYSPGIEMSGTVVASPPNSKFPAGSEVYMRTTYPRSGSAREYTIGVSSEFALQPRNLTPEQCASVPVSALTAWQALFVQAGYAPNFDSSTSNPIADGLKKILIIGASGSAGLWATQLASAAGHHVTGTSHTRNVQMVRNFGAEQVIDYTKTSVRDWLEQTKSTGTFDLVLDCVGGKNLTEAWFAANPGCGFVLSIVAPESGPLKWSLDRPEGINAKIKGRFFIMESVGEQLQKITELLEAGKVRPVIDSVFELEDYRAAFDRVESGKATGKVVIRVQQAQSRI